MTTDPIAAALTGALRRLDSIVEREGWDRPSTLWAHRNLTADDTSLTVQLLLRRMDVGDLLLSAQPAQSLLRYAHQVATRSVPEESRGLVLAFAFVTEAWMVVGNSPSLTKARNDRTIHQRPDRIEIRILTAVDTAGVVYSHIYPRDAAHSDQRTETASRPIEVRSGMEVTGDVVDALRILIEASA